MAEIFGKTEADPNATVDPPPTEATTFTDADAVSFLMAQLTGERISENDRKLIAHYQNKREEAASNE